MNHVDKNCNDPIGLKTLQNFSKADKFNNWLYDEVKHYQFGTTLEIGSGIGSISSYILQSGDITFLSDLRNYYCDLLKEKFKGYKNLSGVIQLNLADEQFSINNHHLLEKFDTIIALNVVEHIENDKNAIQNCYQLLKPNGRLIILVPAFQKLYNTLDKELGHYRRYTKISLQSLLENENLKVTHTSYFNSTGIPGWFFAGTILKRNLIPEKQLFIYNKLVSIFRFIDKIVKHYFGLSVIAVGIKSDLNH